MIAPYIRCTYVYVRCTCIEGDLNDGVRSAKAREAGGPGAAGDLSEAKWSDCSGKLSVCVSCNIGLLVCLS